MDKRNHIFTQLCPYYTCMSPKHELFKTVTYIGDCLKRQPMRDPWAESNLFMKNESFQIFEF